MSDLYGDWEITAEPGWERGFDTGVDTVAVTGGDGKVELAILDGDNTLINLDTYEAVRVAFALLRASYLVHEVL